MSLTFVQLSQPRERREGGANISSQFRKILLNNKSVEGWECPPLPMSTDTARGMKNAISLYLLGSEGFKNALLQYEINTII